MRTKILASAASFVISVIGLVSLATGDDNEAKKPERDSIVIPSQGVKELSVTGRSALFRITVITIAAGEISEPQIKGPECSFALQISRKLVPTTA